MTVRDITQLGAPALRLTAKRVEDINSREIRELISDLFCTLENTSGVGIAAPQISASWQIMIVASRPTERYPDAPDMPATAMINPSFIVLDEEQETDWEGCLSIPGIRAKVPRYKAIEISYTSQQGKQEVQYLKGVIARVFQHEYDHLNGLVYLDRVTSNRDIFSEGEFLKLSTTL